MALSVSGGGSGIIADILEFIYDFWAPTMVLPFLVGCFWYAPRRVYAVVAAMFSGLAGTVVWRFLLGSPWDVSLALFGFVVSIAVFVAALPLAGRLPLGRFFRPLDHLEDLP